MIGFDSVSAGGGDNDILVDRFSGVLAGGALRWTPPSKWRSEGFKDHLST